MYIASYSYIPVFRQSNLLWISSFDPLTSIYLAIVFEHILIPDEILNYICNRNTIIKTHNHFP